MSHMKKRCKIKNCNKLLSLDKWDLHIKQCNFRQQCKYLSKTNLFKKKQKLHRENWLNYKEFDELRQEFTCENS